MDRFKLCLIMAGLVLFGTAASVRAQQTDAAYGEVVARGQSSAAFTLYAGGSPRARLFANATEADLEIPTDGTLYFKNGTAGLVVASINGAGNLFTRAAIRTSLATGGMAPICFGLQNYLSTCSSSLRYKSDVQPYVSGLNLLKQLSPISFTWRDAGVRDIGLGAEDVEKVAPLLVTYNNEHQVEGVKYDRLTVVLVNAFKEQQSQIEQQQQQIDAQKTTILEQAQQLDNQAERLKKQQSDLDALKVFVCAQRASDPWCR